MKIGDEDVVTLKTAAKSLNRSRKTLVAQAEKGVLRATLEEGRYWVSLEEIERYRQEHLGKQGHYDHKAAKRKPKPSAPAPTQETP